MSDAIDTATAGLNAAETQLQVAAINIANAGDTGAPAAPAPIGSSAVAPALTGTPPGNSGAQVFPALQAINSETAGGGVKTEVSQTHSPVDLAQQILSLIQAKTAFQANAAVIRTVDQTQKRLLDVQS
jgi:flagellar hook protein FlgE